MNTYVRHFILLLTWLISSTVLQSQITNPVVYAVPTLTIAPDARGASLGNTGVATSPDVYSQFWNPAKYVFSEREKGVSLSYSSWLSTLMRTYKLTYLSGFYNFSNNNSLSMSAGYLSKGKITFTQNTDYIDMSTNLYEFYVDGAIAHKFTDDFSASLALRYINSNLYNELNLIGVNEVYAGNGFTANIGAYYRKSLENGNLALGMNISEIGTKISFDNYITTKFLPANLRLGVSYRFSVDKVKLLSINADVNKLLVPAQNGNSDYENTNSIKGALLSFSDAPGGLTEEMKEVTFSAGMEFSSNNQLFLRAGYFHESPKKGFKSHFALGGGYALGTLKIDMAYVVSTAKQFNLLDRMLKLSLSYQI
jgi:hypothetical protein